METTSYSQSFTRRFISRTILAAVMAELEGILRSSRCPVTRTLTCVPPTSITRILLGFLAAVITFSARGQSRLMAGPSLAICTLPNVYIQEETCGGDRGLR